MLLTVWVHLSHEPACACASHRGAIYLNATPFWAFMPRPDALGLLGRLIRRAVPYDGRMPAPGPLKAAIRALWWDRFTTKDTIATVLRQVYHDRCVAGCTQSCASEKLPPVSSAAWCAVPCSWASQTSECAALLHGAL